MKKRIRNFMVCMILISTLIFSNMFVMTSEAATTSTGWKHNNIGWWYVTNKSGSYYKNTWQKINGKWYYFKKDGYMAASEYWGGYWVNPNGSWTYVPKATWKKNTTGWWYGDTAGWFAKGKTYEINGVKYHFNSRGYWGADWEKNGNYWYYIDQNGNKITNSIMTINKVKYFFDKTGKMVTNSFITANGHKYFFKSSGAMAINSWITSNSNKYYANANGYIVTGLQTISSNKYYFDKNGVMQKNTEVTINNVTYTIDKNGICTEKKEDPVDPDPVQPGTEDPIGGDDPITVDPPTPSHTHTWETVAAKEPTCTEIGWNEYKKCTDCDKTEGYTEIPALGHDMKSEVIAPTCTTDGYTRHWCDRCDTVFENTDIVEATGHDFAEIHKYSDEACTDEITEVSCDQSYWYKKKCTKCESWTAAEYHNAGEHFWSDWTVSKAATCKEDGKETRICQNCGKKETRTISKETVAHTYTDDWTVSKIATCAEDGEEERLCTVCGEGRETRPIDKSTIAHTYEVVTENVEFKNGNYLATTCDPNKETYYYNHCTVCGHDTEKIYVSKKNHDFTGETKYYTDEACTQEVTGNLDCETAYYYKTKCSECGTWSDVQIKPAGEHVWVEDMDKHIEPTCKSEGYRHYTCNICGATKEEYIAVDATKHTGTLVTDAAIAATCCHTGLTEGSHWDCCGKVEVAQEITEIDPTNHEGEEIFDNNAVAATCRKTGKTASTHCSACGVTIKAQQTTPKDPNNHTNWLDDDGDGDPIYSRDKVYYILDDDLVEELNLPKNKYYSDEIDNIYGDDKYYYNEEHWWASDFEINKYLVQDYASYGTTPIDVTWYWRKALGVELNKFDYHTWLIPKNPLIIAGAANNNMTPEAYTELLIDYYENHYYLNVTNFITIEGICQEGLAGNIIVAAYNPSGNGNGIVYIRRYTAYTEHHNYKYCKDCKTEIEVEADHDEIFDNQISGTIMGYTREYS